MSLKEQLLNIIDEFLEKSVSLDQMFDHIYIHNTVDVGTLMGIIECVYYKKLIQTGVKEQELLGYLSLLRSEEKPSLFTYLYLIYRTEKLQQNKTESTDDFNHLYI